MLFTKCSQPLLLLLLWTLCCCTSLQAQQLPKVNISNFLPPGVRYYSNFFEDVRSRWLASYLWVDIEDYDVNSMSVDAYVVISSSWSDSRLKKYPNSFYKRDIQYWTPTFFLRDTYILQHDEVAANFGKQAFSFQEFTVTFNCRPLDNHRYKDRVNCSFQIIAPDPYVNPIINVLTVEAMGDNMNVINYTINGKTGDVSFVLSHAMGSFFRFKTEFPACICILLILLQCCLPMGSSSRSIMAVFCTYIAVLQLYSFVWTDEQILSGLHPLHILYVLILGMNAIGFLLSQLLLQGILHVSPTDNPAESAVVAFIRQLSHNWGYFDPQHTTQVTKFAWLRFARLLDVFYAVLVVIVFSVEYLSSLTDVL